MSMTEDEFEEYYIWVTKDGKKIRVCDLEYGHLRNIVFMCIRKYELTRLTKNQIKDDSFLRDWLREFMDSGGLEATREKYREYIELQREHL